MAFREERADRSKTYASDESIDMSSAFLPCLGRLCGILKVGGPKARIFDFTYPAAQKQLKLGYILAGFLAIGRALGVAACRHKDTVYSFHLHY